MIKMQEIGEANKKPKKLVVYIQHLHLFSCLKNNI